MPENQDVYAQSSEQKITGHNVTIEAGAKRASFTRAVTLADVKRIAQEAGISQFRIYDGDSKDASGNFSQITNANFQYTGSKLVVRSHDAPAN
jgi:hypothetical protein